MLGTLADVNQISDNNKLLQNDSFCKQANTQTISSCPH